MTAPPRAPQPRIAILPDFAGFFSVALFVALAFAGGAKKLCGPDTFWHIKAGEIMLDRQTILTRDIFSHTAAGNPWTAHEWLSEIIMAWWHQLGGIAAVVLFFSFLSAATFWLLYTICRRTTPDWLATPIVLVAFCLAYTHLLARPHIFSWFLGLVTIAILQKGTQSRLLYLLPPITLVWANLHGGFMLSLLFQIFFITGPLLDHLCLRPIPSWQLLWTRLNRPILILVASTAAACINPFGCHLLLFPFYVTSPVFTRNINEWLPADLLEQWYLRSYLLLVLLFLFFQAHRLNWTQRLFILYFINAALAHCRHFSLAGLFLSPIWSEALAPWGAAIDLRNRKGSTPDKEMSLSPYSGLALTLVLFLLLLSLVSNPRFRQQQLLAPLGADTSPDTPSPFLAFLKDHPQQGKMFNNYGWGGILIYTFGPEQKVFIDGRADMYGEKIFTDYQKIIGITDETEPLLDKYGVDWVLFGSTEPLTRYLKRSGAWLEIYRDKTASILVRHQAGNDMDEQ
ncbi:MAG: hypothetical protein OEV91_04745 [Desulfobulbaceae bacterium]|nr:hypothetical protein [Desulfobulbaceae bacterium]